MHLQLINYLFSAILILSGVVFVDVLIKLKNPLIVKLMLLLIIVGIGWNAFATIYTYYQGYNRWMIELPYVLIFIGCLNFFSLIYSHNVKNRMLLFSGFLLVTQLYFLFYFSWIHPVEPSINIKDITQLGILRKVIKVVYATLSLVIIIDIAKKITKKYSEDNLYFNQVRKWTIGIGGVFSFCMIVHIVKTVNESFDTIIEIVKGTAHFAALLLILYRPIFLNYADFKIVLSDRFNLKGQKEFANLDFIKLFFDELYFLNTEADINFLADKLGTNVGIVHSYIKENYQMTFPEFVNKHRVDYFVSLIASGECNNQTIESLALKAGFSSRQNLNKCFKKFHGGNPSDLIRAVM